MNDETSLTQKLRPRIYLNTALAILAYAITATLAFSSVYLGLSHYGYEPFNLILAAVIVLNIIFIAVTYYRKQIDKKFCDYMLVLQLIVWYFAFSITLFYMANLKVLMLMASIMAFTFAIGYLTLRVSIYCVFFIALTYLGISYLGITYFDQPGKLSYDILVLICYIPVCCFVSFMADRVGQQRRILKATLVDLEAAQKEREQIMDKLEKAATTDDLTGLYNRRAINENLQQEYQRVSRYDSNLTIVLADVDHFKSINDSFGHSFGDEVLKTIADVMKNSIRGTDCAGRWGGEEFLIILRETELAPGKAIAERMLNKISNTQFISNDRAVEVTISAGIHQLRPDQSLEDAIAMVDVYLYEAKNKGRNCIVDR